MENFDLSFLNFSNMEEIQAYYQKYLKDEKSVDPTFAFFFKGVEFQGVFQKESKENLIVELIKAYRKYGHFYADLNPVPSRFEVSQDLLNLKNFSFSETDLDVEFPTMGLLQPSKAPLKEIIDYLKKLYCQKIGFECEISDDPIKQEAIYKLYEKVVFEEISKEKMIATYKELCQAEVFETFLHLRFPGHKRFSIEGGESFIPMMLEGVRQSQELGINEIVFGMAHRGRLNFLANVMKKPLEEIYSEFDSKSDDFDKGLSGDVKYHKGYVLKEEGIELTLCPNPSHLEAVNPVVLGRARAKILKTNQPLKVLPILIHGDASIAGQGIVYEILQMDRLDGFETGGTIHVVINNQIGFTANSEESRSTHYCTDIAKGFNLPVIHVNAEDPVACLKAMQLALLIRQNYQLSVFIDYCCYRKYGHNETDEARFTQPILYQLIHEKPSIRNLFEDRLKTLFRVDDELIQKIEESIKDAFAKAHSKAQQKEKPSQLPPKFWFPSDSVQTDCSIQTLKQMAEKLSEIPETFNIHPKLKKLVLERKENFKKSFQERAIDYALAEQLAFGSCLLDGISIRLVGEDSKRGTFSHRHAVLIDQLTEDHYYQLNHLVPNQALMTIYNSFLSEYGAMGYEYGFSVEAKNTVVIWEAQFGDFANCAQVVIDQFIASGFQKWKEESNLILFLPHGFEGMGPEHSSARIERFMQLCAQNNMELIYPTIASQIFHAIRRQAYKKNKNPMVVFTPKALLRHPESFVKVERLSESGFLDFIEESVDNHLEVEKIVFTIGKLIYDLLPYKKDRLKKVTLVRIEKLYPLNVEELEKIVSQYPQLKLIVLAQEEPINAGGVFFLKEIFEIKWPHLKIRLVAKEASASVSTGSSVMHLLEQQLLIQQIIEA
jgi:2-oxoglutarate dehydrogenase E1 component